MTPGMIADGVDVDFVEVSSHRITLTGRGTLRKDLSDSALTEPARLNRWPGMHEPTREPMIYRALLAPRNIGPRCIATGTDWIEIERIDAPPLWQIGEAHVWIATAAWLAAMHGRLRTSVDRVLPLVVHDHAYFEAWRRRAASVGVADDLLAAHERASDRLAAAAPTVIHGDLYPSNVLAADGPGGVSVWPIDWELAGRAPGVLDLAALSAGEGLDDRTRQAMEEAYVRAAGLGAGETREWRSDLAAARLHLCIQWLACSGDWVPPAEHRQDWLAAARRLVTRC
jgi:Phosphotransferase enzyme family